MAIWYKSRLVNGFQGNQRLHQHHMGLSDSYELRLRLKIGQVHITLTLLSQVLVFNYSIVRLTPLVSPQCSQHMFTTWLQQVFLCICYKGKKYKKILKRLCFRHANDI